MTRRQFDRDARGRALPLPISEKFFPYFERTEEGCWPWLGWKSGPGRYGLIRHHGKNLYAHRVSWQLFRGSIPSGLYVCHKCDNPPCVNPAHLFLGTQTDNMRDMILKGRGGQDFSSRVGSRNPASKLRAHQVKAIRESWESGGVSQAELATTFGVSVPLVQKILACAIWRYPEAGYGEAIDQAKR